MGNAMVGDVFDREMELTQATKFGFMIESLILAAHRCETPVCPAHPDQPLPIRDLAPDLVSKIVHIVLSNEHEVGRQCVRVYVLLCTICMLYDGVSDKEILQKMS